MAAITVQPLAARIVEMARLAARSETISDIPAELPFAQCAIESDWLSRAPGNNCLGIKATTRHALRQTLRTFEIYPETVWQRMSPISRTLAKSVNIANGKVKVEVDLEFAVFPSLEDCFDDHSRIVRGTYTRAYAAADWKWKHQARDLKAYIFEICQIYATAQYGSLAWQISQQPNVQKALLDARKTIRSNH